MSPPFIFILGTTLPHRAVASLLLLAGALSMASPRTASAKAVLPSKPTVVLVHGAFADSSSWDGVISPLLAQGYPVVAASIPMRGLKSDAANVAAILKGIQGPIVLVGHSYGGAVITNAASACPNVTALVYVAGLALDAGETSSAVAGRFPGSTLGPTLAPPVPLPDGGNDLYIRQSEFPAQFAADVPRAQAERMAVTQRPINEAAFNEPSSAPAWKATPSWFIFGSLDKNIPAEAHAFMAERAGGKGIVRVEGASHVVMISHPDAVVSLISQAAGSPTGVTAFEPGFAPAPVVAQSEQPPARLIVDAPLPAQLSTGYVVVRYRTENLRIMPVYGPAALGVSPRIGHLHVTIDDLPWHWLDASGEPLSINGLPPGSHKLLVELEDPTHRLLDSAVVTFEVPPKTAAHH